MAAIVTAIIPARLGSRRFSRKVLYPYRGKPLLFYVWQEITRAKAVDRVIIATDSSEIEKEASAFGAEVIKTSSKHKTGSDRVAEVAEHTGGSVFINIQADNFGLKPALLNRVIGRFCADRSAKFGTIAVPIKSDEDLFDPNIVKVIAGKDDHAIWFSRFPIPYLQHACDKNRSRQFKFLAHVGVYLYKKNALKLFRQWGQSSLEKAESLEQLRIIENGGRIRLYRSKTGPVSVDTPDDVVKLNSIYR